MPYPLRLSLIVVVAIVGLFVVLAVVSAVASRLIEQTYPPAGRFLQVDGGRLHVLELGPAAPPDPALPALVLLHGASSNLQDMRLGLGDRLAQRYRVILIDRPGHGWSDRIGGDAAAFPARQAEIVEQALVALNVDRAVLVVHSWAGALGAAFALRNPERLAGLVMLAPVTHPWPGGIAWYYTLSTTPVVSTAFVHALSAPLGWPLLGPATVAVFAPQLPPDDYVRRAAIPLVLRPSNFLANARDVANLKASVAAQAPRYGEIKVPTVLIHGAEDTIVSPTIHSMAFANAVAGAKLILLPATGHMPHYAAPDIVVGEIDRLMREAMPPAAQ